MVEELVGLVKPFQQKTGTWIVTIPKDVVVQAGLEAPFKEGVKIPVYYDKEKRQFTYRLPGDSSNLE